VLNRWTVYVYVHIHCLHCKLLASYCWILVEVAYRFMLFMIAVVYCSFLAVFYRFMEPAIIAILGGVLPFGSIFIEMYVWNLRLVSAVSCLFTVQCSKQYAVHPALLRKTSGAVILAKHSGQELFRGNVMKQQALSAVSILCLHSPSVWCLWPLVL